MEVELHLLPATFTGAATLFSSYVNSGTLATTATANGLGAGSYGWRYRVVDIRGAAGAWVSENHPDFIVQGAGPSITGVSPNPVTGANASQPFYVNGANFVSGCNVTLRDLTAGGAPFANMPIAALSSTQIRINPNFTTAAHSWSVEVINPGPLSSGQYNFSAVQPASCLYVDDYPYPNGNPYDPNNTGDETTIDPWRFYNRQCTSYVAWKLNKAAGITKDPWFFYNLMGGHHFSDAGNWAANATALGFLVNNTPSVGAVAHWGYGELGSLGHVAYVEAVNDDGTVNVSEYNRSQANTFGTHCHDSPPRFIHVRDVAGGGGGGPSAPVVSSPKVEGNAVTVSAPSEAGVSYVLESKTSMSDASWTSVATNAGSGGQITLTNAGAAGQRRVYRLRLQ
jgi:surface antigen